MKGISKIYYSNESLNLLELSLMERQEIELKVKKAIAGSLNKRLIKVVYK